MGEETTLEKLFKNMDKNNDGVVSKQVSHHENNWHHQNIDIPCQEFMTICPNLSDEQVKMAFSKFDTSGDDKLDYREFCEMIRQKVSCEMYLNHVAYYILVKPTLNNDPPWGNLALEPSRLIQEIPDFGTLHIWYSKFMTWIFRAQRVSQKKMEHDF